MALPWHVPLEAAPNLRSRIDNTQPTLHKHFCNLNINGVPCEDLQTSVMCEIGISNRDPGTIQRLIAAGMTVARLNMRDLEPEACAQLIQAIRQAVYNYSAELEYVYPLALIVDVRGPDIVTGDLKAGPKSTIELIKFENIRLTTDSSWKESGTIDCLYIGYDHLTDLQPGDAIYIDSLTPGKVKLSVLEVGDDSIRCTIDAGGTISSKMTVRISQVPKDVDLNAVGDQTSVCSTLSSDEGFEHMEQQITWAVGADIDGVLVPDTHGFRDIAQVRDILGEKGKHLLVFACIESERAIDNIDGIIKEADGIYLDRSILSTDLPIEKIFVAQKMVLAKCNDAGKPCICKAVLNEQMPTLCVSDIGNLILDGADVIALELQYESPLKKYSPNYDGIRIAEHCLGAVNIIIRHAERIVWQPRIYGNTELMASPIEDPTKALCISAVELATRSRAMAILSLTNSGRTAKLLSQARPKCPIIAVTRTCYTARQLRFWKSVRAMHYFELAKPIWAAEVDARIHAALDYCKAKRILKAGDPFVIVSGSRKGVGYSDNVRLLYASARDTVNVN